MENHTIIVFVVLLIQQVVVSANEAITNLCMASEALALRKAIINASFAINLVMDMLPEK